MNHLPLDTRRTHLGEAQRTARLALVTTVAAFITAHVWLLVALISR